MGDRAPWEWSGGEFPTERGAIDAYNRLYPEGARSGVLARVEPLVDPETGELRAFELQLTSWPEASRKREENREPEPNP